MIAGFRHKGLRKFHERGDTSGLRQQHLEKIRRILTRMSTATDIKDMDAHGYALHPLKWDREGQWAVTVQANWRIVFRFDGTHFHDVDYIDYH